MQFKIGEVLFESNEILKDTSGISLHTGKELERLTIYLEIKKYSNKFKKYLIDFENENIFSLDKNEHATKRYKVTNFSYKILDNAQYCYVFKVEEVEKLNIASLILAGVEVFPYKYSEEYDKGLIIYASIKITEDERKEIENNIKKDNYFKVIRNGINEDEIDMRFGKILWSEDGIYRKQNIILVEKCYDDDELRKFDTLNQAEKSNIMRMLAYTTNLNNELLNLLLSKNLISDEELINIKKRSTQNIPETSKDFYKVKDIDTY